MCVLALPFIAPSLMAISLGWHALIPTTAVASRQSLGGASTHCVVCEAPLTESYCSRVVGALPPHVLAAVERYQQESLVTWRGILGPNCHWFALGYFCPEVARSPVFVDLRLQVGYFERLGFEATSAPEHGALVVFTFNGHDIAPRVDPATGRAVRVSGPNYREPFHSAIYVGESDGEGVVLQKDGPRSTTFSVQRVKDVLRKLESEIRSCPFTTGQIDVHYLVATPIARWRLGTIRLR